MANNNQRPHIRESECSREASGSPVLCTCAGCTQLCKLVRVGKKETWRGIHAEHDAFELCEKLALPTWIRLLSKPNDGQEEWADFMRSCAEANLSAAARP